MESLDELYQEVILESSRDQRNRGDLRDVSDARHVCLKNPLCGDSVDLWIDVRDGLIREIRFGGVGCSISQAAASLMADAMRGKSVDEALRMAATYRSLLHGDAAEGDLAPLGDLVALRGVKRFPLRTRCATLSFEALERVLRDSATSPV